jgi:hypothetical protein
LIDKTSSIYLYVKLKALASWIFLSFTSFWRNSDSYEYKNKSARGGAQFVPIGMPTTCWNEFDDSGQLSTKIYDKRDDFNFKIINVPNMCSNIPAFFCIWCLHRNWFAMQGPVAIILISWNVIFIWETGYWTRAIKRFALFDLLKSLYSDTNILSKYIPSLQK